MEGFAPYTPEELRAAAEANERVTPEYGGDERNTLPLHARGEAVKSPVDDEEWISDEQ